MSISSDPSNDHLIPERRLLAGLTFKVYPLDALLPPVLMVADFGEPAHRALYAAILKAHGENPQAGLADINNHYKSNVPLDILQNRPNWASDLPKDLRDVLVCALYREFQNHLSRSKTLPPADALLKDEEWSRRREEWNERIANVGKVGKVGSGLEEVGKSRKKLEEVGSEVGIGWKSRWTQKIEEFLRLTVADAEFTLADLCRFCGAITTAEQNSISSILNKNFIKERRIERLRRGKYIKNQEEEEEEEYIDWNKEYIPIDILLPLGIHEIVKINRGDCILLGGVRNAGKTAFCLNFLTINMRKGLGCYYIFNEGEEGVVKDRAVGMGISQEEWDALPAQRLTACLNVPRKIRKNYKKNPNTVVNVVDYIRPDSKDQSGYARLAPLVADIQESLENRGVVLVCVQKRKDSAIGYGGPDIESRPALAMILDEVSQQGGFVISKLMITKAKIPVNPLFNPQGKWCFVGIDHVACGVYRLGEWQTDWPKAEKEQVKLVDAAIKEFGRIVRRPLECQHVDHVFNTKGGPKRITLKDFCDLKEKFPLVDVPYHVEAIARQSGRKPLPEKWYRGAEGAIYERLIAIQKNMEKNRALAGSDDEAEAEVFKQLMEEEGGMH
jgi:hypothetical protein